MANGNLVLQNDTLNYADEPSHVFSLNAGDTQ